MIIRYNVTLFSPKSVPKVVPNELNLSIKLREISKFTPRNTNNSKPPVNWWFAHTLKGFSCRHTRQRVSKFGNASLSRAAAMSRLSFFALFILYTRKRVYVFAHTYLVVHMVVF